MGFTKRQKLALVISLWLYFLWIVAIGTIMRAEFKGALINCIIVGGSGCGVVFVLYILVFSGLYYVPKRVSSKENIKRIKSICRTQNISAIYICIVGFFSLSLSVLLLDKEKMNSIRIAGLVVILTVFVAALTVLILSSHRRITQALRTFELQEKNKDILQLTLCSDKAD